jgi:hypothetical protein
MAPSRPPRSADKAQDRQTPPRQAERSRRAFLLYGALGAAAVVAVPAAAILLDGDDDDPEPTATVQALAAPTDASQPTDTALPAGVQAVVPESIGPALTVLPTGSTYVVGNQRFGIGLVDEHDEPVQVGRLELVFLTLSGTQGTVTEVLPAPFLDYGLVEGHDHTTGEGDHPTPAGPGGLAAITGVFVARPTFTAPGTYGVIAKVTLPDGTVRAGQANFEVTADDPVPNRGEPAIASLSLTATTPEEREHVCSATPPDDMHDLTIQAAVSNGRPSVILFATPAYCSTRTCGPSLEATVELKRRYGDRANFIHVEIYPNDDYTTVAPTVTEWSLPSEPWLFLIDANGTIVERYEGGIGLTELDPAVQQLVGGGPAVS